MLHAKLWYWNPTIRASMDSHPSRATDHGEHNELVNLDELYQVLSILIYEYQTALRRLLPLPFEHSEVH